MSADRHVPPATRLAPPPSPDWPGAGQDSFESLSCQLEIPAVDAVPVVMVDTAAVTIEAAEGTCVLSSSAGELLGVGHRSAQPPTRTGDGTLDAKIDAALAALSDPVWDWRGLVFAAYEDAAATCRLTRGSVTGQLGWFDADQGLLAVGPAGGPQFTITCPVTLPPRGRVVWMEADGSSVVVDGRRHARVDATADSWQVAARIGLA